MPKGRRRFFCWLPIGLYSNETLPQSFHGASPVRPRCQEQIGLLGQPSRPRIAWCAPHHPAIFPGHDVFGGEGQRKERKAPVVLVRL